MEYELLLTERRGAADGILWVTLNRPSRLNALTMPLLAELLDVFQQARRDRSVRCVVITGAGRGFCAGMDFSGGADAGAVDGGDHRHIEPAQGNVRLRLVAEVEALPFEVERFR